MTTLMQYVSNSYLKDVNALVNVEGKDGGRMLAICDCIDRVEFKKMTRRAGVRDVRWLPILLFLESALQAGIHCYQQEHFAVYLRTVGVDVRIYCHSALHSVVCHPQAILRCLGEGPQSVVDIEDACTTLLPLWMRTYDRLAGDGSGRRLLDALRVDEDLQRDYWVPLERIEAYQRALTQVLASAC